MKTFKSIADVERFRKHPLHATVQSLVSTMIGDCPEYVPEDDGWLVLLEPCDTTLVLDMRHVLKLAACGTPSAATAITTTD
jgi:hypothetical protein